MEEVRAKAHKHGYVETLTGRKLYLPDINSKNKMLMNAAGCAYYYASAR